MAYAAPLNVLNALRAGTEQGIPVKAARCLAQRLHIEDCFAGVLPEDQPRLIEGLRQQGRSVCFVGDGKFP